MTETRIGRRAGVSAVALCAAALCLTGCTSLVTGTPTRAAGSATTDGVDLEALDTGTYPTTPLPAFGVAENQIGGALLEAARLANHVVLPTDIDPALIDDPSTKGGYSLKDAASLDVLLAPPLELPESPYVVAAQTHSFVSGFASFRRTAGTADAAKLFNAVLIFPDAAAATAAATEMGEAEKTIWAAPATVTPLPIPGHPEAVAATVDAPYLDSETRSFAAYGQYVLIQVTSAPTPEAAAALIAKTLDAQRPLLDGFTPTAPAELVDLPWDASGLLTRTLPTKDYLRSMDGRVREPAAALHYQMNPLEAGPLFDDVGMVAVANGEGDVYQTSTPEGAQQFAAAAAQWAVDEWDFAPAADIPGMPNAQCFGKDAVRTESDPTLQFYVCVGTAGEYAFMLSAQQETDVHQKMAAQYMMLTAP